MNKYDDLFSEAAPTDSVFADKRVLKENEPLMTRNEAQFERIPALDVESN